jgi:Zn-dependent peptidase ImmA (M78 family)/transcriptional regulator with XRE-family HTH domain
MLARAAGVSAPAVSQFEGGVVRPSPASAACLADTLGVPAGFFALPLVGTHEGFFRSLRRTPVGDRRRARGYAHIAHDLATCGEDSARLPAAQVPEIPVGIDATWDEVEAAANAVRQAWHLPNGPVADVVQCLEDHGIVVIRLPLASSDVDAFSLPFGDHPVVVLGAEKNDRARSRFDAAHELGHLVMHGDRYWGMPQVERQAHRFASAFLLPRREIRDLLPARADWPALFTLKRRWQVSLAALLYRARTLGCMDEADYLTAVKASSARGWRRVEPVPLGSPEVPTLLSELLAAPSLRSCRDQLPDFVIEGLASALAA